MGQPPEERERRDEDLFEDLDDFFAPLEESGWAEEGDVRDVAPPPEAEGVPEEGAALEDWEVAIDVPDADELLAAGEPARPEEEERAESEAEPEERGAEREALEELEGEPESGEISAEEPGEEGPLSVEDLRTAPAAYADLPAPDEDAEGAEAPVLPEEVSVEDLFEEEEEEPAEPVVIQETEEPSVIHGAPDEEAVEAAAEHFASGVRGSPGAVERDLLADLEDEEEPETETVTIAPTAPPAHVPSWQEGADVIEEPAAAPPGGRNLLAAFASGGLLALAVLALLLIGKGAFAWFAGAVVLLGQAELYAVMRSRRLQPATLLGLVCGAFILAGSYLHGAAAAPFGLALAMGLTVLWYMAAPAEHRRSTTVNAGVTILGTVYVPFLASFALLLLGLPGDVGTNAFLVVVGLTVLYDVSAYAVGTLWGNRPLSPTVSPNKSWEGAIGATLVILIVALAIVPAIDPFNSSRAVGLALVIALVAPIGDLVESALKRDLGVKDMGTILPGHGGILDRIDAILFTAPAAYYFLLLAL